MTSATLGSLVLAWLSISSPAVHDPNNTDTSSNQASLIVQAWPDASRPTVESVEGLLVQCGRPNVLIVPPRPSDPLQGSLVSQLSKELAPLSFIVEDGERLQLAQERDADRTFAETSDATAAARVLLARQGDFELKWHIEVAMDGPKDLYGVETWQATAHLHATLVDLLLNRELPAIDVESQVRQRTREDALDQSIAAVTNDLARAASRPLLRSWFAASIGQNVVLVDVSGQPDDLVPLQDRLQQLPGVNSVARASPAEPPRLLVEGSLTAGDVVDQLGEGRVIACRQIALSTGAPLWWLVLVPIGLLLAVIVLVLVFRGHGQDSKSTTAGPPSTPEG
ncbi:MAG: hypothetical protein VX527_02465 [Planctomycetota bacterium]|nr:hypothetical protein [Planctomycetota bacterium]